MNSLISLLLIVYLEFGVIFASCLPGEVLKSIDVENISINKTTILKSATPTVIKELCETFKAHLSSEMTAGQYLLTMRWADEQKTNRNFYAISVETGEIYYLFNNLSMSFYVEINRSNEIVLNSFDENKSYIYDASGSLIETRNIPESTNEFNWSPDLFWIARIENHSLIFSQDIDSEPDQDISFYPEGAISQLKWSPNGNWLAFLRTNLHSLSPSGDDGVYLMDAHCLRNGMNCNNFIQLITPYDRPTSYFWSPDSNSLMIISMNLDLIQYSLSERTFSSHIEDIPAFYAFPLLDGQSIVYKSDEVEILPVGGGEPQKLDIDPYVGELIGVFSNYPQPIFQIGSEIQVTSMGQNVSIVSMPSINGSTVALLAEGDELALLEGPVEQDYYIWWKVRMADGQAGWIAENPYWYTTPEE